MNTIRALARMIAFVAYTSWIVLRILIGNALSRDKDAFGMRIRKTWSTNMLSILGIRLQVLGTVPDFPCIIMGNHRSYLDPVLIMRDAAAVPVSKAEVASWPIIGFGAKASGVLFLKRESPVSRKKTLDAIADQVLQGRMIVLFPEGTTHSHPTTIQYRKGGFQIAANHNIPIVPLAVNFRHAADNWIGDDTFIGHFFRRFSLPEMEVILEYGQAISNPDAEILMNTSRSWTDATLSRWQEEGWNLGNP